MTMVIAKKNLARYNWNLIMRPDKGLVCATTEQLPGILEWVDRMYKEVGPPAFTMQISTHSAYRRILHREFWIGLSPYRAYFCKLLPAFTEKPYEDVERQHCIFMQDHPERRISYD